MFPPMEILLIFDGSHYIETVDIAKIINFMLPKNDKVVEKNDFLYWILKIYDIKSHLKIKLFKNMHCGYFCITEGDRPI